LSNINEQCEFCGKLLSEHLADNESIVRTAEISNLSAYLASTDWYATRMAETGKAIPEEIIAERQKARDRISELKA